MKNKIKLAEKYLKNHLQYSNFTLVYEYPSISLRYIFHGRTVNTTTKAFTYNELVEEIEKEKVKEDEKPKIKLLCTNLHDKGQIHNLVQNIWDLPLTTSIITIHEFCGGKACYVETLLKNFYKIKEICFDLGIEVYTVHKVPHNP